MSKQRVTITDVAREAGVALGTVSNALNHPSKVRPDTLALVEEAIKKLGYSPNQSARLLAGGSNRTFGLVLPSLEHGISLQIANGANAEARKHGYGLLMANADNDEDQIDSYVRHFAGTQMAGVLIQIRSSYDWKQPSNPSNLPTVFLDCYSHEPGYFVGADNITQGKLIAQHAIDSCAKHVVVLGEDSLYKLGKRLKGIQTIASHNPQVVFEILNEGSSNLAHDGYTLGYRLAKRPQETRPDFIIALSDVLATGAVAGLQAAGLRVGEDVCVAGCDGNPLAWSGNTPLTTIAPPGYEIGRKGVQYLIQQIKAQKEQDTNAQIENHQALVRPFLFARASTGAANTTDFANPDIDISGYL